MAAASTAKPTDADKLRMSDQDRGVAIKRVKGHVTWVHDFKDANFMKLGDRLASIDASVLAAFGFKVSDKMENVCKACKQIARARGNGCCPAFERGKRVKKMSSTTCE